MKLSSALLSVATAVAAHSDHDHDQTPLEGPHEGLWYNTLPGDGGTQVRTNVSCLSLALTLQKADSVFSGISTFGRIQYHPCLSSHSVKYDIAFIGALSMLGSY